MNKSQITLDRLLFSNQIKSNTLNIKNENGLFINNNQQHSKYKSLNQLVDKTNYNNKNNNCTYIYNTINSTSTHSINTINESLANSSTNSNKDKNDDIIINDIEKIQYQQQLHNHQ